MDRPWRNQARQQRSRETDRRIVAAAVHLIGKHGFDGLPVARVAKAARVSVGGLYARFADKLALVHAVDEQLVRQFETALGRAMAPPALADLGCSGVIRAYVTAMVRYFTRHRALLRHVVLRARGSGDPAFSRRVRALNRFAHGRIGDELRRRRHEITHPDPAAAAAFGVMLVSAAARECVLFGNRRLGGTALRGPRLVDELVRSYCAYLGVACTKE